MTRYFFALFKSVSFVGLFCLLSLMATGCKDEASSSAQTDLQQEGPSLPAQILEKTMTTSVSADDLNTLVVAVPHYIKVLEFESAEQEDISIAYNLIADDEEKLSSVSEDMLSRTDYRDRLVVLMPESEDCEIFINNEVLEHLRNMCLRSVTVTLPAGKNIEIYDANSDVDPTLVSSVDLAWPGEVPESVEELVQMYGRMRWDEYKFMALERFLAAGGAEGLTVTDTQALVNSFIFDRDRLIVVERLAESLRESYGGGIPIAELDGLLDLIDDGDQEAVVGLLSQAN